jgi:putative DNA-invertase from lambdoid prophage Rac
MASGSAFSESFLDTTAEFGELVAAIFAFVASFERWRIVERIAGGLERARAQGRTLGRPRKIVNRERIWDLREAGKSIRQIAAALKLSHGTVQRNLHRR